MNITNKCIKSKINIMTCECCEKDENGDWIREPCCDHGYCEADTNDPSETRANCIHCGGEMFKEVGYWWHNSQEELPLSERWKTHIGP